MVEVVCVRAWSGAVDRSMLRTCLRASAHLKLDHDFTITQKTERAESCAASMMNCPPQNNVILAIGTSPAHEASRSYPPRPPATASLSSAYRLLQVQTEPSSPTQTHRCLPAVVAPPFSTAPSPRTWRTASPSARRPTRCGSALGAPLRRVLGLRDWLCERKRLSRAIPRDRWRASSR